jgi:hypothetical protein
MSWFRKDPHVSSGATLTVTDAARQYIFDLLVRRNIPQNVAARLKIVAGNIDITMGPTAAGDQTVVHRGRTILLLDAQTAMALSSHTVDVQQTASGPKIMLRSMDAPWSL